MIARAEAVRRVMIFSVTFTMEALPSESMCVRFFVEKQRSDGLKFVFKGNRWRYGVVVELGFFCGISENLKNVCFEKV